MFRKLFGFILIIATVTCAFAQNDGGNSPYSRFGIGDQPLPGLVKSRAMGGTGVALFDPLRLNVINPALLGSNKAVLFEQGLRAEYRSLASNGAHQNNGNIRYDYVYMAFPIIKDTSKRIHWTTSIGYSPFSTSDYNSIFTQTIPGDTLTATTEYVGNGSLNSFAFSNGFKIGKRLYLGLESTVLFGPSYNEKVVTLEGSGVTNAGVQQLSRSGIKFKGGIVYEDSLFRTKTKDTLIYTFNKSLDTLKSSQTEKTDKFYYALGGAYDFGSRLNAENLETIEAKTLSGSTLTLDTVNINENGTIKIPSSFTLGLSIEHRIKGRRTTIKYKNDSSATSKDRVLRNFNRVWKHAVDFSFYNWANYEDFNGNKNLFNSYRISYGLDFSHHNKRNNPTWSYQFGIYYGTMPFKINNETISDVGITFGASTPMTRSMLGSLFSSVNLTVNMGHRGKDALNVVDEYYVTGGLSFIIGNHPGFNWFRKRIVD